MKAMDVLRQQRDTVERAAERWTEYAEAAKKDPTVSPGPETCQRRADEFTTKAATIKAVEETLLTLTGEWLTGFAGRNLDPERYEQASMLLFERVQALINLEAAPQEEGDPR